MNLRYYSARNESNLVIPTARVNYWAVDPEVAGEDVTYHFLNTTTGYHEAGQGDEGLAMVANRITDIEGFEKAMFVRRANTPPGQEGRLGPLPTREGFRTRSLNPEEQTTLREYMGTDDPGFALAA